MADGNAAMDQGRRMARAGDVHEQLNRCAWMLDGVAAALDGFAESSDLSVGRQAPMLAGVLDRLNEELSSLAEGLARQAKQAA